MGKQYKKTTDNKLEETTLSEPKVTTYDPMFLKEQKIILLSELQIIDDLLEKCTELGINQE